MGKEQEQFGGSDHFEQDSGHQEAVRGTEIVVKTLEQDSIRQARAEAFLASIEGKPQEERKVAFQALKNDPDRDFFAAVQACVVRKGKQNVASAKASLQQVDQIGQEGREFHRVSAQGQAMAGLAIGKLTQELGGQLRQLKPADDSQDFDKTA